MIHGNALGVAGSPQQADQLLEWGVEIERNLSPLISKPEVFYAAIHRISIMNQYNMLACVIADDELFGILKEIYAQVDDGESVRLYLSALRHIKDESLDVRKKELRKILNAKKKELSSAT